MQLLIARLKFYVAYVACFVLRVERMTQHKTRNTEHGAVRP